MDEELLRFLASALLLLHSDPCLGLASASASHKKPDVEVRKKKEKCAVAFSVEIRGLTSTR